MFICAAVWLILILTGAYLWLVGFRSTAAAAYSDMESLRSEVTTRVWIRRLHWAVAIPSVLLPLAVAASSLTTGRRKQAGLALAGVGVFGAGWLTGQWLPWNQMGLWAFPNDGYTTMFDDDRNFILLAGRTVTSGQLEFAFHTHTKLLPIAAIIIVAAFALTSRRSALESD